MKRKQTSIRFPVHITAKLNALHDLYPHVTRTQIVSDLLDRALKHLEQEIPVLKQIDDELRPPI